MDLMICDQTRDGWEDTLPIPDAALDMVLALPAVWHTKQGDLRRRFGVRGYKEGDGPDGAQEVVQGAVIQGLQAPALYQLPGVASTRAALDGGQLLVGVLAALQREVLRGAARDALVEALEAQVTALTLRVAALEGA